MAQDGIIAFIRRNWIAYLIGAVIAILLGLGMSFYLGSKWSTPVAIKSERTEARKNEASILPDIDAMEDDAVKDEESE